MEQFQSKVMTALRRPGAVKKIITGCVICVALIAGAWMLFGEGKEGGDEVSLIPNQTDEAKIQAETDGMPPAGAVTGKNSGGGDPVKNPVGTDPGKNPVASLQAGASQSDAPVSDSLCVDVAGAVVQPRVVTLPAGSRVYEALEAAGGLTAEADLRVVNRALALSDGDKIYVPTKKETAEGQFGADGAGQSAAGTDRNQSPVSQPASAGAGHRQQAAGGSGKVNINTADASGLQQLAGVGPAIAGRILDYRAQNGAFRSIEDLKKVSGIGPKTFEKLKDGITV